MMSGIIYLSLFCILLSLKDIYSSYLLQNHSLWLTSFWIFFVSLIMISLINFFKLTSIITKSIKYENIKNVLLINLFSCFSFGGFLLALKNIQPSVVDAFALSLGPLFIIFRRKGESLFTISLTIMLLLSSINLALVMSKNIFSDYSAMSSLVYGFIGIALASGGMTYQNLIVSDLLKNHWSHREIIQIRYFLLVILSGILCLHIEPESIFNLNFQYTPFGVLALFGNLLPLYLLNKGVEQVGAKVVAFFMPLKLVLTFFLEQVDERHTHSSEMFFAVMLIAFLSLMGTIESLRCFYSKINCKTAQI